MQQFNALQTIADIRAGKLVSEMVKAIGTGQLGATGAYAKIEKKDVDIILVYGVASGVKTGIDERQANKVKAEWSALTGKFYAVKCDDPTKVYQSGRLFLPASQEVFETAIVTGELDSKDRPVFGAVEFAVMIVAEPANNAHGYRWKLRNLMKASAPPKDSVEDRLLANMEGELQKQLPAPAPAPEGDKKGKAA